MRKSIYISTIITILLFNCKEKDTISSMASEAKADITISKKEVTENKSEIRQNESLKDQIKNAELDCLDFDNLFSEFEDKDYSNKIINRNNSEKWISELEKTDSIQFERADLLAIKCKVFENNNIVSVAFVDLYDYKTALHLFTFQKPELTPTSSFIFFLYGGDGEDFWNITPKRNSPLEFEIEEEYGYDNSAIKKDELLIKYREKKIYKIDSTTGKLTKKVLDLKKDFKEFRK